MSRPTTQKIADILPGETLVLGWDFRSRMATAELVTGTPTITRTKVKGGGVLAGLTLTGVASNAAETAIDGQTVPVGQGVVGTMTAASEAVSGTLYLLELTAVTTEGQTLKERALVEVK